MLLGTLKERLFPNGHRRLTQEQANRYIDQLIEQSLNNWRTRCYDRFQYCVQGIM